MLNFPYLGEVAEWSFQNLFFEYSAMGFVAGFGVCFVISLVAYVIFKLCANIG